MRRIYSIKWSMDYGITWSAWVEVTAEELSILATYLLDAWIKVTTQ